MSLLFNMLSRLVIAFLPRSKPLLLSWLQRSSAVILEPKKIKSFTVSIVSPSICHEVMGQNVMISVFWMLTFKPTFSLSSFTFIKRLFTKTKAIVFSSSHVWILRVGPERRLSSEELMLLNCVVGKDSTENRLDCKEIQPVHPKGNQSWIFIGRTDAEAETPILWPPNTKNWLTGKDPDAGKDLRWEEKEMTGDEMVAWHH